MPCGDPPAHLYFGAAQPQGDGSTGMSRQETVCSSLPPPQPGALALLTGPAPGYPGAGLRNSSRTPRPRGWSPVTVTRALWGKKSCTQIESLSLYKRGFVKPISNINRFSGDCSEPLRDQLYFSTSFRSCGGLAQALGSASSAGLPREHLLMAARLTASQERTKPPC